MTYRHVVWDMGGTLIDTYPAIDALFAHEVTKAGGTITPNEVARLTRIATSHAMTQLSARYGVTVQGLTQAYDRLKAEWRTTPPPVMPGAREVIAAVRQGGGRNVIVTHRDRSSASDLLQATGLQVDDLICAPDGYRRKPDPQMYLLALRRHQLDPGQVLAIGDREIDAAGAQAAGMTTVWLRTPSVVTPTATVTDMQVSSLKEVLPLVSTCAAAPNEKQPPGSGAPSD